MKLHLKRSIICAVLGSVWTLQSVAGPLETELRTVMDVHPGIKAARTAAAASQDRLAASKGSYFPKLSISGDTGKEKLDSRSYLPSDSVNGVQTLGKNGLSPNTQSSVLNREKLTMTVEQSLFNGGRRAATVDIARLDSEIQARNLDAQVHDVLMESLTAYLQVARYQTLIGLSRLNEETTQRQLELERKRVEGGGGISVDVLQARTRLQIVRERRVFYEQGLRDAIANYEQVFGRPPVLEAIQDVRPLESKMPSNVIIALEKAMENNQRLKAAALQVAKTRQVIELEKAAFLPSVDLVAIQGRDRNVNQSARRDEASLLVRMNWTLASGGETINKVAAALKDLDEQEARQTVASNKIRESVRVNWNQLINGNERLELLDSAAAIARDVMEDRKRLRDAGKESALVVLDAEVEYYGVLANKVNALFDNRLGSYRLLQTMGELTPENLGLYGTFQVPVEPLRVDLEKIARPSPRR